jgi:general stress protein 26
MMKPFLQIQRRAHFSTEVAERHGFWNEMPAHYFSGPDDPNYGLAIETPYRIELDECTCTAARGLDGGVAACSLEK